MKIVHLTSQLDRHSAGLGAAVAAMSAATQAAGHETYVFGLSSAKWVASDGSTWAGAPATTFETVRCSGPIYYAPRMLPALLDVDPDIVHLHGLWTYPSVAALRWQRITGGPLVLSAHGMLYPESLKYNAWRKRLARKMFQDRIVSGASILHATSKDEETAYRALGFLNRVEIVPWGINAAPCSKDEFSRAKRRALFLGRLHHQKGIDWLVDAWIEIESEFPDWELSIVGPPDPKFTKDLEKLKHKAADRRVSFIGPLYGKDRDRYMAGAELVIMPSRSENFGIVAAESLMMEIPVIASRGAPWSGLVENGAGWWVDPEPFALKDAMREAMKLPTSQLRTMGRNGRRWMEKSFSWSAIGGKWQAIYESLDSQQKAPTP